MKGHPAIAKLEQAWTTIDSPEAALKVSVSLLGSLLQCDRCFLYVRSPTLKIGKVPFCWCRTPDIAEIKDADWKVEPSSLPEEDPMFLAALRAEPSIFVEDVETAQPDTLNRQFERENFGHRALVHAHLCSHDQLWAILQPCVFDQPRLWSENDRALIHQAVRHMSPLAIHYVTREIN
ncbi:MAG: GAF domain-containing protein [Leptolyngbyaceae bacterium]|nr:GAF domain-containing protein [Leptolyngbyaceae bacterium]